MITQNKRIMMCRVSGVYVLYTTYSLANLYRQGLAKLWVKTSTG